MTSGLTTCRYCGREHFNFQVCDERKAALAAEEAARPKVQIVRQPRADGLQDWGRDKLRTRNKDGWLLEHKTARPLGSVRDEHGNQMAGRPRRERILPTLTYPKPPPEEAA